MNAQGAEDKKTRVVGLTGSIGAGKSQVAGFLQDLGAAVIDADHLAREAVQPHSAACTQIAKALGNDFISAQGSLERVKLAEHIFANPEAKSKLEQIVHPRVRAAFRSSLEQIIRAPQAPRLIVFVAPLLLESRQPYPELEKIILVSATKQTCLSRVARRGRYPPALAEKIYNSQLPDEIKKRQADYVICNEGTLDELRLEVEKLYRKLVYEDSRLNRSYQEK